MAKLYLPKRMPLELRAIGLDVDGTVRKTAGHAFEAFCKTVEQFGGKRPDLHSFTRDYRDGWKEGYFKDCGVDPSVSDQVIHDTYFGHLQPPHEEVPPCDDVFAFLSYVQRHEVKLFVVSGNNHYRLMGWFTMHELHPHFHTVQGSCGNKIDALREACESMDASPEQVAYVGDWGIDVRAALAAGLVPIGITRGHATAGALLESGAAYVVETLTELQQLIR